MAGPIVVSVIGDVRDLVAGTKTAKGELTGLAKVADRAGRAIKGGLLIGGAAAVAFGVKAVRSASDAQQSIGATEAVYGRFADVVIDRSNAAAEAVGLSANEYRELANVTGAMLASAGTPLRKVTELTDQLTRRAADMAATFGGTTKDAVSAVGSLLRGETDPIERYGVSIKQADIKARLAAKGLDKLTGSARKQAEQQERVKLLFEQTSKAAGQFADESGTLAGQQQRLSAKVTDLEAKFGTLLLPVLTDVTEWASEKAVPALEDLADWLGDNRDEFADIGATVKGTVLPVLEGTTKLLGTTVGLFTELPGPIKEVAVQAAVAAVVFPRLAAGVTTASAATTIGIARLKQFHAELTYTETRAALASGAIGRFAQASRTAAGVGGMVALTAGASSSNKAIGVLAQTAGGAALGFAVGGPWGAAIGAAGGALIGLVGATDKASGALKQAEAPAADYASSLDQITGAATRATREVALLALQATPDAITSAAALGISTRDLVDATLGHEGALKRVNAATAAAFVVTGSYRDANGRLHRVFAGNAEAADIVSRAISGQNKQLTEQIAKTRADALVTENLSKVMRGVPKNIRTKIATIGDPRKLTQQLREYVRQGKLTPKQIRTIVRATGLRETEAGVARFSKRLVASAKAAEPAGKKTGDSFTQSVTRGLSGAGPKLSRAAADLVAGTQKSAGTKATSGSPAVGTAMASGFAVGLTNGTGLATGAATRIVNAALAAMRAAADIHSPSRETEAIADQMDAGFVNRLTAARPAAGRAGRALAGDVLKGMTKGAAGVNAAMDKLADRYIKAYNRAHKKDLKPAEVKALHRALDGVGGSLAKIANQYARTLALAKSTTAEARSFASVTSLGEFGVGAASGADGIVTGLQSRLSAIKAFQADMAALGKAGLSKDVQAQLLAAGVEGGSAYADALANGGPEAIKEVNRLQRQINAASKKLGDKIAPQVTGLDKDAVRKAAERASRQIAAILKRKLGVKVNVTDNTRRARVAPRRTAVNPDAVARRRAAGREVIKVHFTAEQLTQLERGRRISADLAVYRRAGGR